MRKASRDTKGFALVELLIVLAVLVAVGSVGFYAYHRSHKAKTVNSTANHQSSTQTSNKTQTPPPADSNTTLSTQNGYSFSYPNTWKTVTDVDGLTSANRSSIVVTSKDLATSNEGAGFHVTAGALVYVLVYDTKAPTSTEYLKNMPHMQDVHTVTVAGQDATQYWAQWESSPNLVTVMVKDGKAYQIILDYADQAALQTYRADYDALVASFKLK